MPPVRYPTPEEQEVTRLRAEKLKHEIRHEAAKAKVAELEQLHAEIKEKDRLVRPGVTRRYPFYGVVNGESAMEAIMTLEHWAARDPGEEITIMLNSPGGDVSYGFALFDTIKRLQRKGHKITIHGQGTVASMAAVLLQAADERVLDARAKVLLHEGAQVYSKGAQVTRGEEEDMRKHRDMLVNDMLEVLSERSTLTKRQIENKMKRTDWWMSAEDAVKFGFADRVE